MAITGCSAPSATTRWHLTSRAGVGGQRYAVYVDGRLVTEGHDTGEAAVAEATRVLAAEVAAIEQAAAQAPLAPPAVAANEDPSKEPAA